MESEGKNSLCIFCFKKASSFLEASNNGNGNSKCSIGFLQLLQRYLKVVPGGNKEINKNWKDLVSCDNCFELGDEFCNLFFQWEALRLELEWNVRRLFDRMKCAGGASSRLEAFQDQFSAENESENEVYNGIHVLRMDILEGCQKKLDSSFPKLILTDILEDLNEDDEEFVATGENTVSVLDPSDLLAGMMSHLAVLLLALPRQSELGQIFNNQKENKFSSQKLDKQVQTCLNLHFQLETDIVPQHETEKPEVKLPEVLETDPVLNCDEVPDKNTDFHRNSPEVRLIDLQMDIDSSSNPDVYEEQHLPQENTSFLDISFENEMINEAEALKASEAVTTPPEEPEARSSFAECDICHSTFNPGVLLTLHLRSEHGINAPFKCPQCNFKCQPKYAFRQHMRQIHKTVTGIPGPSQCSICQEKFSSSYTLNAHMRMLHHKKNPVQCKTCSKFFENKTKLYTHTYHVHNQRRDEKILKKIGKPRLNPSTSTTSFAVREVLRCHLCQSRYLTREGLATHAKSVHKRILAYECVWCGTKLKTVEGFRSHMRFLHGKLFKRTTDLMNANNVNYGFVQEAAAPTPKKTPPEEPEEKQDESDSQPETIALAPSVAFGENVAIATNEISQKSSPSASGASPKFDFPTQRRYLHSTKPVTRQTNKNPWGKIYKCDFPMCNQSYRNKLVFDTHRQKHEGEKPFTCWAKGCNLEFMKNVELAWHYKKIHLEHNFQCSVCSSIFSEEDRFLKHVENHNNSELPVVPLENPETEKQNEEERNSSPNPTWKCSICQASFNLATDLAEHIKLKHKEEHLKLQQIQPVLKFSCTPCGKEFGASEEFVYHMFSVHGKVLQALGHDKDVYEPEWKYVCPEFRCGLKCPTLEELAKHLKTHTEGNSQKKGGTLASFEEIQVVQPETGSESIDLDCSPNEEL
ncbi:unnamed protein product [Orchesella dallaii]|uniref:C2H2-type domain-containing protein n=1 Tax=Orchesella dallaii TaxID=48710 RepID=A0ABP1RX92_9HEXA